MKYINSTEINLPIETVAELWNDEGKFDKWQDGFISMVHLSGEKDQEGSKSELTYQQGKKNIKLIETVISNNLPNEKSSKYEHIHMTNLNTTRFKSVGSNKTEFSSEIEYIKFKGFMPKLMSVVFPGMFKKQSQKWMDQFKEFAENSIR